MFVQSDLKNTELGVLKNLSKKECIKNYSKMKKSVLFKLLIEIQAAKCIQRCFRKHFYKNAVDHISLDPVEYPCFIYRSKSGKCFFYSYDSIIKYIMKTGDCRDPMTREHYSDDVLKRLDLEAKNCNLKYRSTYKIKINLSYARRIRNRENEILSYQLRLDELKEQIFFILHSEMYLWNLGNEPLYIENVEYSTVHAYIQSVVRELKMVLVNVRSHDSFTSDTFKKNLLESIKELNNPHHQFLIDLF